MSSKGTKRRDDVLKPLCSTARLKVSHHQTLFVSVRMSMKERDLCLTAAVNLRVLHTRKLERIFFFFFLKL